MFNAVRKFIHREVEGIRNGIYDLVGQLFPNGSSEKHEITQESDPGLYSVTKEISENSDVHPKRVELIGTKDIGGAHTFSRVIQIGKKTSENVESFKWTYAHELGHEKFHPLHQVLTFTNLPYRLLFLATTTLYAFSSVAYPFAKAFELAVGKEYNSFNWANSLLDHTGQFLIAGSIINAITTRVSEHMADLFAYKYTGILPSEGLTNYRTTSKSIIVNIAQFVSKTYDYIGTGYPMIGERNLICKLLTKKKTVQSFVDRINSKSEPQVGHKSP